MERRWGERGGEPADEVGAPLGWSASLRDATPEPQRARSRTGAFPAVEQAALRAMGVRPAERARVVRAMLLRRRRQAAGYWPHLMLAVGIATLGLALSSTAVVIGAMLVSPLMNPVVELGMGLATGSPVLTLRALARAAGGAAAAVLGAALLATALPFHEITPEIAARTAPNALDLFVAVLVALVVVVTAVRARSDAAAMAAGTALGVSLIPPLCVAGFGLGTGNAAVATGSALLFLTNFTAVVSTTVLGFLFLGFEHVETGEWDRRALRATRGWGVRQAAEVLRSFFGSRYGRVVRLGLPLLLLALVAAPLAGALRHVAWEMRARTVVSRALAEVPTGDVVQSAVSIRQGGINVRLYVVGSPLEAAAMEQRIVSRIRAGVGDVEPVVRVVAMPQASVPAASEPVARDPAARLPELAALRERLDQALTGAWAATGAGPIVRWELRLGGVDSLFIVPTHLGEPVAAGTRGLLDRVISQAVDMPVAVRPEAVPEAVEFPVGAMADWLSHLERTAPLLTENRSLQLCVVIPEAGITPVVSDRIDGILSAAAPGQVDRLAAGSRLGARLSLHQEDAGACPIPGA